MKTIFETCVLLVEKNKSKKISCPKRNLMRRLFCLQINSQNQNRNIFGKTKRIGIPNMS